jgi:hypothetical protein
MAFASHQDERTALQSYQRKIINLKTLQLEMLVLHIADVCEELSFLSQNGLEDPTCNITYAYRHSWCDKMIIRSWCDKIIHSMAETRS